MDADSYLVRLIGTDEPSDFKHFVTEGSALAFAVRVTSDADADEARVYRIPEIADARTAVVSYKAGHADLLHVRTCKPSPAEAKDIRMTATFRAADRGDFTEADRLGEYGYDEPK